MSNSDNGFLAGVILTAVPAVLLFGWIVRGTDDSWREQIANHGCAEFYLDEKHDRQWRWK